MKEFFNSIISGITKLFTKKNETESTTTTEPTTTTERIIYSAEDRLRVSERIAKTGDMMKYAECIIIREDNPVDPIVLIISGRLLNAEFVVKFTIPKNGRDLVVLGLNESLEDSTRKALISACETLVRWTVDRLN